MRVNRLVDLEARGLVDDRGPRSEDGLRAPRGTLKPGTNATTETPLRSLAPTMDNTAWRTDVQARCRDLWAVLAIDVRIDVPELLGSSHFSAARDMRAPLFWATVSMVNAWRAAEVLAGLEHAVTSAAARRILGEDDEVNPWAVHDRDRHRFAQELTHAVKAAALDILRDAARAQGYLAGARLALQRAALEARIEHLEQRGAELSRRAHELDVERWSTEVKGKKKGAKGSEDSSGTSRKYRELVRSLAGKDLDTLKPTRRRALLAAVNKKKQADAYRDALGVNETEADDTAIVRKVDVMRKRDPELSALSKNARKKIAAVDGALYKPDWIDEAIRDLRVEDQLKTAPDGCQQGREQCRQYPRAASKHRPPCSRQRLHDCSAKGVSAAARRDTQGQGAGSSRSGLNDGAASGAGRGLLSRAVMEFGRRRR